MRLVFKVSGAPIIEVRQGNKYVSYSAENVALFEQLRENYDLLEFKDDVKIPVEQLVSVICDKLHVCRDEINVTNTWRHFEGDHTRFLLFGEVEFTLEGTQPKRNIIDVTDEMYDIFDEVFNDNGCFYDKSGLEQHYHNDLDFLVLWDDDVTKCLGCITESRKQER